MSPEHGVSRAVGSLWRAIQVDPSYYVFWLALILMLAAVCTGPVWWELHGAVVELRGIRRALEAMARR